MNAQQAENLRILIRHMETNVRGNLEMLRVRHACGSPSCAYGHAEMVPALQAQGIKNLSVSEGAIVLFGLTDSDTHESYDTWMRLFGSSLVTCATPYKSNTHPTPQEWATEARKVLAERGYSMDSDDGFGKFMERVREPITALVP